MVLVAAMVVVVVSLATTVVVLKVVVVKGVGLVKRAWMVVYAAAKLEALLAAAEDRQVGACFLPPPTYETMK